MSIQIYKTVGKIVFDITKIKKYPKNKLGQYVPWKHDKRPKGTDEKNWCVRFFNLFGINSPQLATGWFIKRCGKKELFVRKGISLVFLGDLV